jgi:hypothetical protein
MFDASRTDNITALNAHGTGEKTSPAHIAFPKLLGDFGIPKSIDLGPAFFITQGTLGRYFS